MLEPSLCSSFSIESKSRCFAEAMDCPFRVVHHQQVSSLQERPGGDRPTPRLSFSEQPIRFLGSSTPLSADSRCQKRFTATRIFRIGFCEARERSLGSGDITEQPCSACGIPLLSDSRTIGRRIRVQSLRGTTTAGEDQCGTGGGQDIQGDRQHQRDHRGTMLP